MIYNDIMTSDNFDIDYYKGWLIVYDKNIKKNYPVQLKDTKTNRNITRKQFKQAVKFFLKYADKWHSYANDYQTVSIICSLVNLQILNHNKFNQVKVNTHNANLYLNQG